MAGAVVEVVVILQSSETRTSAQFQNLSGESALADPSPVMGSSHVGFNVSNRKEGGNWYSL